MEDPFAALDHDPRDPACSHLRAGDRDRDAVQRALGDAFAEGRLTRDELDERSDRLVAARTLGALPPLVDDLVPSTPARRSGAGAVAAHDEDLRARAVADYRRQRREAVWGALSSVVVCVVIWAVVMFGSFFWPGFVILGTALNVGRVLVMRESIIEDRVGELERKRAKKLARQDEQQARQDRSRPELPPPAAED